MKNPDFFRGKTVLVTGAAAGIGRGICEALYSTGAIIFAGDINEPGLDTLKNSAPENAVLSILRLDVSKADDFTNAVNSIVDAYGQLDVVINNAGIVQGGDFHDTPIEAMQRIVDINLWSVLYGTKIAYAQMRAQGHGHIANISSSAGMMPVPNSTMYSAIKHGVIGFSHSLREEAAQYGIDITTALPGMVQSDLWENAENIKDYDYKKRMQETGIKPITAATAAEAILDGITVNKRSIIFPRLNRVILRLYQLMPNLMTKLAVAPMAKKK